MLLTGPEDYALLLPPCLNWEQGLRHTPWRDARMSRKASRYYWPLLPGYYGLHSFVTRLNPLVQVKAWILIRSGPKQRGKRTRTKSHSWAPCPGSNWNSNLALQRRISVALREAL